MQYKNKKNPLWLNLISLPIIWLPLPFVILLDITLELYHQICFPWYWINKVVRSNYVQIIDRAKLQYLSFPEKLWCIYCWYVNWVLLYRKNIASLTEQYRCWIMHANKPWFLKSSYHDNLWFVEYWNEEIFKETYK